MIDCYKRMSLKLGASLSNRNAFALSVRLLLSILVLAKVLVAAQPASPAPAVQKTETKAQRDARMEWWREAKFGLFIHWGVYSVPAGYYHGQPVSGIGEWIMKGAKIPMAEYQEFAKQFNPTKFDAEQWVKIAKDAGMKYIVITSKHHEGFAMFETKASPWNIVQASPYGKDILQPLAEACRKGGIRLGFYYSQAQDWNNGGSASSGKWDPAQQHDMDDYIDHVAVPQVRELLTNYGPDIPAILWWDTPTDINKERADKLHALAQALRPDLITNDRLGGGYSGDTVTPEQHIPAGGYPGRDWETCMTINATWGYKRDDQNWKSTETLLRNLIDIASKGGNYLLNVGPDANGVIPQPEVERLTEVGRWLAVNGEAIYGSGPTPFPDPHGADDSAHLDNKGKPTWVPVWDYRCTTKPGKIFVHLFLWPGTSFTLPGVKSAVTGAYLLADRGTPLKVSQNVENLTVALPAKAPDPIASVLVLETKDK